MACKETRPPRSRRYNDMASTGRMQSKNASKIFEQILLLYVLGPSKASPAAPVMQGICNESKGP